MGVSHHQKNEGKGVKRRNRKITMAVELACKGKGRGELVGQGEGQSIPPSRKWKGSTKEE